MRTSRKLLFIKNRPDAAFARSWIMDEFGMHSRTIGDATLLGGILSGEQFDVVLLDQRGSNEELIPSIEGMRHHQPHARLVVVSDEIGLSEIKQAMRFNVHDIFLPPFDLPAVIERVETELAKIAGVKPLPQNALLSRWSELASTLEGNLDAVVTQVAVMERAGVQADANREGDEESRQKIDTQAKELEALRTQLNDALEAKAKLVDQMQRLSSGASALARTEARVRELETELMARSAPVASAGSSAGMEDLQAELEEARRRISQLERTPRGDELLHDGASEPASDERVRQLEAELAEANQRFEAAGQAFAGEMELMMAREAESQAALAQAEQREKEARAMLETAGDAFGRADDSIERERESLQAQRDALGVQETSLRELGELLDKREATLTERAEKVMKVVNQIDADTSRMLQEAGEFVVRVKQMENRRKEIAGLVAQLRDVPVN